MERVELVVLDMLSVLERSLALSSRGRIFCGMLSPSGVSPVRERLWVLVAIEPAESLLAPSERLELFEEPLLPFVPSLLVASLESIDLLACLLRVISEYLCFVLVDCPDWLT